MGEIGAQFLSGAVVTLFTALIVQLVTNKVAGFKPAYGAAYLASFLGLVVAFVTAPILAIAGIGRSGLGMALSLLIIFLVGSALYGWLLKHPETGSIGIRKGILVSLVQLVVIIVLVGGAIFLFSLFR